MFSILIFPAILSSTNSLNFKCNFQVQSWSSVGALYTCNNLLIESFEVKSSLESVIGVHQSGMTTNDVAALSIRDQNLPELPQNMKTFFPNLRAILLYNSGLRSISSNDLQFPMLEYFASMLNKVHAIDGDLFKHTPALKVISFNRNSLDYVGENIFKDLNALINVDMSANDCVDFRAWTTTQIEQLSGKLLIDCTCSNICSLGEKMDDIYLSFDESKEISKTNSEKIVQLELLLSKVQSNYLPHFHFHLVGDHFSCCCDIFLSKIVCKTSKVDVLDKPLSEIKENLPLKVKNLNKKNVLNLALIKFSYVFF